MGDIPPISPNDDVTAKYVITEVDIQTVITEEIYVTPTDVNDEAKNVVDETLEPSQQSTSRQHRPSQGHRPSNVLR